MKQNIEDKKLKDLFNQLPKQPSGLKLQYDVMRAVRQEAAKRERRSHRAFALSIGGICALAAALFAFLGKQGLFSSIETKDWSPDKAVWTNTVENYGSWIAEAPFIALVVIALFGFLLYDHYRTIKKQEK